MAAATRLLIRRVRLDVTAGQVSADPRARRRRTLHPDQRALPLDELAEADAVYGYSFIVTNLDVTTPGRAAALEHWYRHRTQVENVFRDAKHGAALRHLPSGYPEVNRAWMWGALLAASLTGWLHQLTARASPDGRLLGHGVRDGQAMIATLRHRLIRVPARLVRHAGRLTLRLPPGATICSPKSSRASAPCPPRPDPDRPSRPRIPAESAQPEALFGPSRCPEPETRGLRDHSARLKIIRDATRGFGSDDHEVDGRGSRRSLTHGPMRPRCCQNLESNAPSQDREGAFVLVGDTGIEPVTSSV